MKAKSPLAKHHWLFTALVKMGYRAEVANTIAYRHLLGQTLFPNEKADAIKAEQQM